MVGERHGYEFIQNVSSAEDIESVIKECEAKSSEILDDAEIQSILDYIGI
jgi:hypothetical protein